MAGTVQQPNYLIDLFAACLRAIFTDPGVHPERLCWDYYKDHPQNKIFLNVMSIKMHHSRLDLLVLYLAAAQARIQEGGGG